jgi:hypothetical protein
MPSLYELGVHWRSDTKNRLKITPQDQKSQSLGPFLQLFSASVQSLISVNVFAQFSFQFSELHFSEFYAKSQKEG